MISRHLLSRIIAFGIVLLLFLCPPVSAQEVDSAKLQNLVDRAKITFEQFVVDPNMTYFRENLKEAKAILIVPRLAKAALIFGGSGGSGTLLARDAKKGDWSDPAFYSMGSGSVGLQIGGAADQVVLMVRTKRGMDAMLSTSFKLGTGASVAAGPVGSGTSVATADILAFVRSKGAFVGVNVEGSVINTKDNFNKAYYGKPVRPVEILVLRKVSNPKAAKLRAAVKKATK